jgi:hypothetical protein
LWRSSHLVETLKKRAGKIDSSGEEIRTDWKRNRKEKDPVLYTRW